MTITHTKSPRPCSAIRSVLMGMSYITHSFQAYCTSIAVISESWAKTKFFDADGALVSEFLHAFAVTTVFGKLR